MILTLVISHNIFLKKQEIDFLVEGVAIETIGTSVPVWFYQGNTSEPAKEVFCKYKLTNTKEDYPIAILATGYQINLPQRTSSFSRPSKDDWLSLTVAEREIWKNENPSYVVPKDLLGVSEDSPFHFKKYHKIREPNKKMNIIHCVEIGSHEMLEKSLF